MAIIFPSQGPDMSFERSRYPTYLESDSTADVIVEQARVLVAALPIRSATIVHGDLVTSAMISVRSPTSWRRSSSIPAPIRQYPTRQSPKCPLERRSSIP